MILDLLVFFIDIIIIKYYIDGYYLCNLFFLCIMNDLLIIFGQEMQVMVILIIFIIGGIGFIGFWIIVMLIQQGYQVYVLVCNSVVRKVIYFDWIKCYGGMFE